MKHFITKSRIAGVMTLSCFFLFLSADVHAQDAAVEKRDKGVVVYPKEVAPGSALAVQLEVVSEKIIHVVASPTRNLSAHNSLTVVAKPADVSWKYTVQNGTLDLSTASLHALVSLQTGAVRFTDMAGKPLVAERNPGGRTLTPAMLEGESLYTVRQTFDTDADDAWYGLGQHQDDVWNYKGRQVVLFQNNTEVAVPFLVSKKNYGILWDNYSLSKVGDCRDVQPLTMFRLFDKNGNEGWLTASYANDRNKPQDVYLEQAESSIAYSYVNDSKLKLPTSFSTEKGMITWQGSIASDNAGEHTIKFLYAGYIKVWIDGKLQLEKWRQAWNPGVGLVLPKMEKGRKYAIKIEWMPDGGESYLTAQCLPPVPAADVNSFTFASEAGRMVDYYFVAGSNMDEVISGYRTLTGKAHIMPKWSMGFWQSRERYKTQDEILQTIAEFRKRQIPIDNIVLDWSYWKENDWGSQEFEAARFPNPDSMISALHTNHHAHFMISVWPKFYEGISTFNNFWEKGWLYKRNVADRQRDWIAQGYVSTFYDAFNADARKGFWNLIHDKLYTKGIDAWWMDASEPDILSNVSPARRKEQMSPTALGAAAEFLNAYPLQNAKGIYEGQRGSDPDKRVFLLTRSGFAGSQRYAAAIWSGDIASRWEDMRTQITAGMNFSMSGLPYWTMDIGGFSVERRYEKPNAADLEEWRALQTRWYQFGTFAPLLRIHGQFPYREVYNVALPEHPAYKSMLYYNQLRYRLMPYIYSLAGQCYHKDYTMMRGLVMDFGQDSKVTSVADQFMFGPSLMINPVYSYQSASRKVYLPQSAGWYDLYSGQYNTGGKEIEAPSPYERMPVFVKAGSIIPVGPAIQYTDEKPATEIILYVYAGADADFALYEDDGLQYNYEKGAWSEIPFHWNEASRTLTVGARKGAFPQMLMRRTFKVVVIDPQHPQPMNFTNKPVRTIAYSGKEVSVQIR